MSLEKVLQKIHGEIKDLAPTLELFLDDTIQPSVKDCELLQQQLALLQENIAVYKYNKLNKEISPSFNIHAKVSQKENIEVKTTVHVTEERKDPVRVEKTEEKEIIPEPKIVAGIDEKNYRNLVVNLNDKFRFINELFAQNNSEYHIALEQLNTLKNWNDTEIYLNSLKSLYEWETNDEVVKYFYSIVKKRFDWCVFDSLSFFLFFQRIFIHKTRFMLGRWLNFLHPKNVTAEVTLKTDCLRQPNTFQKN